MAPKKRSTWSFPANSGLFCQSTRQSGAALPDPDDVNESAWVRPEDDVGRQEGASWQESVDRKDFRTTRFSNTKSCNSEILSKHYW